ncbi:uncharacterized protein LOC135125577 isoform X2 [Zophobas morio]|uniref:uncharacterized protein LOC135125577 isoform X2 n=1 Tax=Zophobas morio TaxID=2755281 RepID=UPI003083D59A
MEMDLEELVTSLPTVINEIVDTDPYRLHIDADVWVRGGEVGCSDFGDLELFANQACHPTTVISRPVMPAPFPWPASTSATPHCNLFVPPLVRSSTAESTSQLRDQSRRLRFTNFNRHRPSVRLSCCHWHRHHPV